MKKKQTNIEFARQNRKTMPKAEVILWQHIRKKQLGVRFLRQYCIDAYIVDFYASDVKLAIEVDGATHCSDEEISYDQKRTQTLSQYGIEVIRFTNQDIYQSLTGVIETIRNKIAERL
ncbi:MAG: endonuclease domain-containing protein [bacterium]|nr:endonuclease domain-containing protein [bacterium]